MAAKREHAFYTQLNDGKISRNPQDLEIFVPGELIHFTNQSYWPMTNNVDQSGDLLFYSIRQSISPERQITCSNPNQINENERPLLEELEIYPKRIFHKSLLILNPFHIDSAFDKSPDLIQKSDLAGPLAFCLLFGICLFIAGSKVHFGYIYGLSMISVCGMYALLSLMSEGIGRLLSFTRVASALGYGILPIVWLSFFNIFVSLNSTSGIIVAMLCIILATLGSSRMLCLLAHNSNKRILIAYPCALTYIAFTLFLL